MRSRRTGAARSRAARRVPGCRHARPGRYCSTECQRIDWRERGHRKACKKIRDERAAEAARAEASTPPSIPKPVVYGPAPRSHADEIRARIAAEHEAARARREANPEPVPLSERYGSRCPICMEKWDVNESTTLRICCCRKICSSCEDKLVDMESCPLCRAPFLNEREELVALRRHVENGVPEAMNYLANSYRDGEFGFAPSAKKAAKLFKRAVALGNVDAMVSLGALYDGGVRIEWDWKKAMQLWQMASDRGSATGQHNLGLMLRAHGEYDKAITYLELAKGQGREGAAEDLERVKLAPRPPKDVKLRFAIGDAVECATGQRDWTAGTVVALWYHEEDFLNHMPAGFLAPYQIRALDDRRLIWAPEDQQDVIRARLRFTVGDAVECCCENEETGDDLWVAGEVKGTWLYWKDNDTGKVSSVKYAIKRDDNGEMCYAPLDTDACVRRRRP